MNDLASNLSRRNILKAAALVPAAAIAGSAANSAVTVGLLGSGGRGTTVASALQKNTKGRIVALCDLFDEKMQQAKGKIGLENPKTYTNFHDLLASDVDAIIIATPVFLHPEHLEAAVKSGKHIYIEKPAGVDVEGCKRIMHTADSADSNVNITFGFQRRYGQVYLKAKQLVDSGAVGNIRMGHAHFIKSGVSSLALDVPRPQTDMEKITGWHVWKELAGDLIVENNVHVIDVLNWFIGSHPKSAIGSGGATVSKVGDMRDHNFVAYQYDNGVQASLTGATLASNNYREVHEQFFADNGMVETSETHWRHFQNPDQDTIEKAPRNSTIDSVEAFVNRIAEGKPENVGVRGAESTLTAILGRMAMDLRREVTWDEMMNG
ncbi:MAG: Gfo/Idh/MocA family oxidoreductase [Acidobacteria bacterium]|nr:Gfo/Idh/MocA family oxidoreductase [Acidobacteriota bacterium]MDA1236855.1 Gfo/Idh/MocA family oxidoreductase [Acidobacteriota bacterium]